MENTSKASASRAGVNLGPTGIPVPVVGQPVEEEDHGVARATLTPGNLSLANQTQDLASLNTDLSNANSQVDPLNIARLKAKQESAAALSELLNSGIGDLSQELGLEEGSLAKASLHTFAAAFVAATIGGDIGSAALAGALSEIANGTLQDVLKADPTLTPAQKSAITQWMAAAVGAAVGGQAGAAAALDNVNHNYLTHQQLRKAQAANRRLRDCIESNQCSSDELVEASAEVAHYKALSQANTRDLIATCSANGNSEACGAKINDLINFVNEAGDLVYMPENDRASPYVFAAGKTFNLDVFLASYLQDAIRKNEDPKIALDAGLSAYAKKEGATKAVLDAIGVAGIAACGGVSAGTCVALAVGAAASANHLYSSARQVITGQQAKTALVEAMVLRGWSPEDAERYQSYVDAGTIVVTVGLVGGQAVYRFAVNTNAINAADRAALVAIQKDTEAGSRFTFQPVQPLAADGKPILRTNDRGNIAIQPNGSVTCGQHSCGMVLDTMGKIVSVDDIIAVHPPTSANGTTLLDLQRIFLDNGVGTAVRTNSTISQLESATANGKPAIAMVKSGPSTFHYVVVDGITKRGGQSVVAIRDPAGSTNGGVYYETMRSFTQRFTGNVVQIKE